MIAALGYEYVPWWGNALMALWLWLFGANVGSFLNVVVFRLPMGRSVVHPRSRCPGCGYAIRWFDNMPVLSWLLLGGRCRKCRMQISSRYPLVEALVAAVFLVVAFLSPVALGENLPASPREPLRLHTMLSLWLMYAYQMLLFSTLIAAALIRFDGQRPPPRLYVPGLLIGMAAPFCFPWLASLAFAMATPTSLRPLPFTAPLQLPAPLIELLDTTVGLTVGAALGLVAAASGSWRDRGRSVGSDVGAWALCGVVLGWQAACGLAILATLAHLATMLAARLWRPLARIPYAAHLTWGTVVYIVCWRMIVEHAGWLGSQAGIGTFALASLAVAAAGSLATAIKPQLPAGRAPARAGFPGGPLMSDDANLQAILRSPSYRLAELDTEFLQRDELRPVRLQLELLKPETILAEQKVHSTIVVFGGTQITERDAAERRLEEARARQAQHPGDAAAARAVAQAERVLAKSPYYDAARKFGQLVSSECQTNHEYDFVIVTGGGPGIMEAANRGAHDVGAKSIGLNITLPAEQAPNPYITPQLCFQFHYFALRKMHFLFRAKALVVFPGGFGTLDELFDALTLRQTKCMQEIPIILFGKDYWDRVIDFQFLADEGVIADAHLQLLSYAETPEEAWEMICRFHEQG